MKAFKGLAEQAEQDVERILARERKWYIKALSKAAVLIVLPFLGIVFYGCLVLSSFFTGNEYRGGWEVFGWVTVAAYALIITYSLDRGIEAIKYERRLGRIKEVYRSLYWLDKEYSLQEKVLVAAKDASFTDSYRLVSNTYTLLKKLEAELFEL